MATNTNMKGVNTMNTKTPEEHKKYKREVIEYTRSLIESGVTGYAAKMKALMKKFDVTDRMAKKYIKYTKDDIEAKRSISQQTLRDELLIQYRALFRQAMELGDRKEAREIMGAIEKLEGLQAAKQINIKTEVTAKTDLSHLSLEDKIKLRDMLNKPNTTTKTIDIKHDEV